MLAEKEQAGLLKDSVISLLGQGWTSFCRSLCWPVCTIHTDVHMHTHHASALGPRSSSSHRQGLERGCFWILRLWSNSGEKPLVPGQGVADSAGVQALCWEELGLTEPILSPFLLWLVVRSSRRQVLRLLVDSA